MSKWLNWVNPFTTQVFPPLAEEESSTAWEKLFSWKTIILASVLVFGAIEYRKAGGSQ